MRGVLFDPENMLNRRTKIVCTLGPACDEFGVLRRMTQAGMNVARLNLSHGAQKEHEERINNLRKITKEIAVIADLQGPRIRTGRLCDKEVSLRTGATITLTSEDIIGDENTISILPSIIISDIKVKDTILIADGTIKLRVTAKKQKRVECVILSGGVIGEHKGVNLPQTRIRLPSLTVKDRKDLEWGIRQGVDYFALSFVRKPADVLEIKKILKSKKANIPVISKIEKAEAVGNLKQIIEVSDAVMVARGDLGVEVSLEKVPIIQKEIIELCRTMEKPVIVATQMLESMVKEPVPTRAEVSDVANAIFDGTDAVMLSEETSVGKFPVASVQTMARIAEEADKRIKILPSDVHADKGVATAVAHAAFILTEVVNAKAIITFTETGSTALRVSKHRPEVPIFGVVTNDKTLRRLSLFFGVCPLKISSFRYIDEMILNTEKALLKSGRLKKNDLVVITAGVPINIPGTTNLIKVHRIGERRTL